MKKILITGGLGFIGSHLADYLSQKNEVTIIDKLSKRVHPYKKFIYKPKNCKIIIKDLNDKNSLKRILNEFEYIYHFASHQDHQKDYSDFIKDNVATTSLIFEILKGYKKNNLKQFVLASSQSVYGEGYYNFKGESFIGKREIKNLRNKKWFIRNSNEKFISHKESDKLKPINFYGLSKYFQEQIVRQCSRELNVNFTILRYSIVQGARQSFFNTYSGLCRNLISSYLKNERPMIFEDGLSTRDFVNIDDVTKANIKILNNKSALNQTFNIGGKKSYSLLEFDRIVRNKLKTKIKPIKNKFFRANDPRDTVSNINKAKRLIGWAPDHDIDVSIESYINWVLDNKELLKLIKSGLINMIQDGSVIDCK